MKNRSMNFKFTSEALKMVGSRSEALERTGMRSEAHLHLQEILYKDFRSYLSYFLIKLSSFKTFVLSVLLKHELKIYEFCLSMSLKYTINTGNAAYFGAAATLCLVSTMLTSKTSSTTRNSSGMN